MSKESFSKKISDMMDHKMKVLENMNYVEFLEKDKYFEFILCLSYMTLSKEKVIKKDIKNSKRLDRLTRMVLEKDVDVVFKNNFSEKMPVINYAKESDNTWILDNIRDSLMHGMFDIDEENEMILINNTQFDRELNALIPFSWFISYAKYDILSKKIMDKYTVKGFYYNKLKQNHNYLNAKNELFNSILYVVNISGNSFNVNDIEKRIKELFYECSNNDDFSYCDEDYENILSNNKSKYDEKYFESFCNACSIVMKKIKEEYPFVNINIYIDNRKNKIVNKLSKKICNYYKNYDFMFEHFNSLISSKSVSFLKYISNIIENIDNDLSDYCKKDIYAQMNLINYILKGELVDYDNKTDIYNCFIDNMNILKNICLNVYGLSTLVINQGNLYNSLLFNQDPSEYNLFAYSRKKYLDYASNEKNLMVKLLEKDIKLFQKNEQLSRCTNEKGIICLTNDINVLENDKKCIFEEKEKNNVKLYIDSSKKDDKKIKEINYKLDWLYNHFYRANSVDAKKKIIKIVKKYLDEKIEIESKFMYGICDNMSEVITIIRNSLAHVGRLNVRNNFDFRTVISLCDYDNDSNLSGVVVGKYIDFISLLGVPFVEQENKIMNLNK